MYGCEDIRSLKLKTKDGRWKNQFPYLGSGELHLKSSTVGDRCDRCDRYFTDIFLHIYNNKFL